MQCSLCCTNFAKLILNDRGRDFYRCAYCDLVFVPAAFHLTRQEEKEEYSNHHNSPNDAGYRRFLNQVLKPLLTHLSPGMQGLDFGSGPGPTLSHMLHETGYPTHLYDPFYARDVTVLQRQHDFVTCTEVVEHFFNPRNTWRQLVGLVKLNGYLAVMTLLHDLDTDFSTWWYKNDPTHVAFYSNRTMDWIADQHGLDFVYRDHKRVTLFHLNCPRFD